MRHRRSPLRTAIILCVLAAVATWALTVVVGYAVMRFGAPL
jgi:hypothetical protein